MKYLLILLLFSTSVFAQHTHREKVSLQLMWLDQFQFAGYYMAKEKGFYKDENLDVEIKKYKANLDITRDVLAGKTDFSIGRSSLLHLNSTGKKIVLLSAIFQSSPLVLIALKSSGIETLKDFENKTLMLTKDGIETASIHAMITSAKINKSSLQYKEHNFNLDDLLNGTIDLYAGYISNEPYTLRERNIKYKMFYPLDEGFDFYDDILFTSQKEILEHPKRVESFKKASLKGWEYAFSHIHESINVIHKKYNFQHKTKKALLFEALELKKLAYQGVKEIGTIDKNKIQRIYDVYKLMGLIKKPIDIDELIYKKSMLNYRERKYLKEKKEIKICVLPNSKPYSAIENGKYVGVGAEILALTKKKFDINYKLVKTSSWQESLQKGINKECDLLPIAASTPQRKHFFKFTTPYHSEPLVMVTNNDADYIIDFDTVLDKTFSVVKGHSFIKELQDKYPSIKLVLVDETREGLKGVEDGKYYGHIDVLVAAAYGIKYTDTKALHISGQFEEKIHVGFGVRKEDKILFDIFEKMAKDLKTSQLQKLLNNWVRINYTNTVKYPYIKEFSILILFITLIFALINYILRKKNEKLESLQKQILQANQNLEVSVKVAISDLERAQAIAHVGSWILDVPTQKLSWSEETYTMFEVDKKEKRPLFESFINRVHPQDRDSVLSAYSKSLEEKTNYSIEHRLLLDDGSIRYVIETCETTFDENLVPLISHGTVQDITQRKKVKEELKKKDALMFQQSRLAQMGEMLSMIAHQWRQPLGSISASALAVKTVLELEKYDLNDEAQSKEFVQYLDEKLDKIGFYVQNLSQIITDFSNFYKPHTQAEFLNVDEVLLKSYRLMEDSMIPTNIQVDFQLRAKKEMMMHENEFMQVILNIINNAKEQLLSKEIVSPAIVIRTYVTNEKIFIEIEDNAGGIDKSVMDEIFDPYFSTKLEKNGTGLGLYMSKIILKDYHNGDIYAKNTQDGVRFIIEIDPTPPQNKKV